jgi:glyoxylase-like metal-dependent hydrolase (beta-lactamase superfamily II)
MVQLLNLGSLSTDVGNVVSGATNYTVNAPPQVHERRELIMISALVSLPNFGLVLFDVGSCEDVINNWGESKNACLPRVWKKEVNGLAEAIKATGAGDIKDVKAVIMSHLHFDHAGGLENFFGTGIH